MIDLLVTDALTDISNGFNQLMPQSDVIDCVERASDFFHIDRPIAIAEGWSTGVFVNSEQTQSDDVLMYSSEQLEAMGIVGKDALDLVMTHEGTHRMLQSMEDLHFTSHQEELCCDYMSGVRAGLNGIDVTLFENALGESLGSETHPSGELRVEAIENGVQFAHEYMNQHGIAPTFTECLAHFQGEQIPELSHEVTLRQEMDLQESKMHHFQRMLESCSDDQRSYYEHELSESKSQFLIAQSEYNQILELSEQHNDGETTGSTDRGGRSLSFKGNLWTKAEIESHKHDAERRMSEQKSYEKSAREELARRAKAGLPTCLAEHQLNEAIAKYKKAKADYDKWCNEKPKDKK